MRRLEFIVILAFLLFLGTCYSGVSITDPVELLANNVENVNYQEYIKKVDQLLYTENNYEEALKLINDRLEKAAASDEVKAANVLFRKAEIYLHFEKQDLAEKTLKQALTLKMNPDQRIYTYSLLAGICSRDSRKEEAISYIWEADKILMKMEPKESFFGSFEFHFQKGTLLLDMGKFKEAAVIFKQALKMQPQNTQLMIELAFCLFRSDQAAEAREVAARWLEANSKTDDLQDRSARDEMDYAEDMARYYLIMGEYEKALVIVEKTKVGSDAGCNMDPERALIYYYWGRNDEAEVVLNRMINNKHSDNWEKAIAGSMLANIGRQRTQYQAGKILTRKRHKLKKMLFRGIMDINENQFICCNAEVRA